MGQEPVLPDFRRVRQPTRVPSPVGAEPTPAPAQELRDAQRRLLRTLLGILIALLLVRTARVTALSILPGMIVTGPHSAWADAVYSTVKPLTTVVDAILSLALIIAAIRVLLRLRGPARTGAVLAAASPFLYWAADVTNAWVTLRLLRGPSMFANLWIVELVSAAALAVSVLSVLLLVLGALLVALAARRAQIAAASPRASRSPGPTRAIL